MFAKSTSILMVLFFVSNLFGQENLKRAFQPNGIVYKTPYGNNPSAAHYVQTKDAKLYYEVYGKGQPLVLLHGGIFGSTIEMTDFIEQLKTKYQVIAISTRGHGKSEMGSETLTLEQRANDAMAIINATTKDSVIVIGFSDGGYSAYKLAAMYPGHVKKIVVIGAGEVKPGIRDFTLTSKQALEMDPSYWKQQIKLMPDPKRLDDLFKQITNCYNNVTVSKELLSIIKCPVLVMAGDHDNGNPVERVVSAARYIPNSQISIIPNTGHGCFLENFNAAWAVINPFIN
jgi:pimeloyl-ACP methyl ester carboxylesterase